MNMERVAVKIALGLIALQMCLRPTSRAYLMGRSPKINRESRVSHIEGYYARRSTEVFIKCGFCDRTSLYMAKCESRYLKKT